MKTIIIKLVIIILGTCETILRHYRKKEDKNGTTSSRTNTRSRKPSR